MQCLLDKVTARYMVQGLFRLAENRNPSIEEMFALDLLSRADSEAIRLFSAKTGIKSLVIRRKNYLETVCGNEKRYADAILQCFASPSGSA